MLALLPAAHAESAAPQAYYLQLQHDASPRAVADAVTAAGGRVTHELARGRVLAALLPATAVAAIDGGEGVHLIEPVPIHRPMSQRVPWHVDQVQARQVWDGDDDGQIDFGAPDGTGVRVCLIDSGVFAVHPDFAGLRMSGMSQIDGEAWDEDGIGHGTRVAGIIAAAHNELGVVGIAPGGLELLVVKLFNNAGMFVPGQSNLAAAVDWCREQGVHMVHLSLGTTAKSETERLLFEELYLDHGILAVAAIGNEFAPVPQYPAAYEGVLAVAGVNDGAIHLAASSYPDSDFDPFDPPAQALWDVAELAAGADPLLSTQSGPPGSVPDDRVSVNGLTFDGVQIIESALGSASGPLVNGGLCNVPGDFSGAVVLCERGEVTFAQKIETVRDGGGVGVLIFNHYPGGFRGSCVGNCTQPSIPAIALRQDQGQALLGQLGAAATLLTDDGSDCSECVGGYGYTFSGFTSQAAAVVSGGAALLWSACGGRNGVSNVELRQLLRDSALDLVGTSANGDSYGSGWDPYTGWGLLQLADALQLARSRFGDRCQQSFCASTTRNIPDGVAEGVDDSLFPVQQGQLLDLDVAIVARHNWPGDLIFRLEHVDSGIAATLIDRPGVPASTWGCADPDIDVVLDDSGSAGPVEDACPLDTGLDYTPDEPLAVFAGLPWASEWRLTAIDAEAEFDGVLESWCLRPVQLLNDHIFADGFEAGD